MPTFESKRHAPEIAPARIVAGAILPFLLFTPAAFDGATLRTLVARAYGLKNYQISGPSVLDSARFSAGPATPTDLQTLLVERFHLKFHREPAEFTVLALTVGEDGPRMKPAPEDAHPDIGVTDGRLDSDGFPALSQEQARVTSMQILPGRAKIHARRITMHQFAGLIDGRAKLPVVDLTNLAGRYDFTLYFLAEDAPAGPIDYHFPKLVEAVRELGLRLENRAVSGEKFVVDHIDKRPASLTRHL